MLLSQNIVNVTPSQAAQYGCDMFQLYYPGLKINFYVRDGIWRMGDGPKEIKTGQGDARWNGFMLGTYNPVNERVVFFDCWECEGIELARATYRDRIALLRTMKPYLFDWMSLANSYRIADFQHVWDGQVETGAYPGVIFRKSNDPATSARLVCIKNPTEPAKVSDSKPS